MSVELVMRMFLTSAPSVAPSIFYSFRRFGWGYLGGSFLIFLTYSAYSKMETPSFMFMFTRTITRNFPVSPQFSVVNFIHPPARMVRMYLYFTIQAPMAYPLTLQYFQDILVDGRFSYKYWAFEGGVRV